MSVSPDTSGLDAALARLAGVTFDFGNTLVPVRREDLRRVVEATAREVDARCGPFGVDAFLATWDEERARQFEEDVPALREADLGQRVTRILARLRGQAAPPPGGTWDDRAAATRSSPDEVAWAVDVYSSAFVRLIPAPATVEPMLGRLAGRFRLGILSNWPLAATIDRFVELAGWSPWLSAIVVSQRVGTIKPHPEIFRAAAALLELPPLQLLHVGDDWAADVVGAKAAGWRAAYLRTRVDSPLPSSDRDDRVRADLEIDAVSELEAALDEAVEPGARR